MELGYYGRANIFAEKRPDSRSPGLISNDKGYPTDT
jgi:hypothetical protein